MLALTNKKDLEFENKVALDLVQAMLGAISPNVRAVSYECIAQKVIVYFVFKRDSTEDRDEAEDITFEFEALQQGPIDIEHQVTVSAQPFQGGAASLKGRLIYLRKEH